ncbi:MAG: hypothetical protein PHY93_18945 [Bacteriovorax sp.]|nr:hypothetical protein [Bacteriovorax sp.]
MYFGEFLLNKKIINEDQLLDALIFQVEHLPSFLRVLREDRIISSSEILKMIQLQLENNSDLISVLKNEQKINEIKLNELYKKQAFKRKMLGSVLVELKYVEQSIIDKMLHEFIREKDNFQKNERKLTEKLEAVKPSEIVISDAALESLRELGLSDEEFTGVEVKIVTSTQIVISDAALESLRELGLSDEEFTTEAFKEVISGNNEIVCDKPGNIFVDEFLNVYNEKMNKKLIKLMSILDQSTRDESDISNYLNSLFRDLFILKGAALLADLHISSSIFDEWSRLVEKKLSIPSAHLKEWCLIALPSLEESIIFLWEVRGGVLRNKCEPNIDMDKRYQKICASLMSIK